MKIFKMIVTILVLGALMAPLLGCNSESDEATSENQVTTVQLGNLTLEITAAGNLELSRTENLAFEIAGTVDEVLVEAGDTVTEGQVLAKLDTSEWEDQVKALQETLTATERQVTTKERALATAERLVPTKERALAAAERQVTAKERELEAAERQVAAKELDLRQAELDLETAEYNLYSIEEVKEVQDAIDRYEYQLEFIEMKIKESLLPGGKAEDYQAWQNNKANTEAELAEAQQELSDILADKSVNITTDVAIDVAKKQLAVEVAEKNLEDANEAIVDAQTAVDDAWTAIDDAKQGVADAEQDVADAKIAVEDAKVAVEDAQQDVADAQEDLDEAQGKSPDVTAPFDGFITSVNVEGGDEVLKGTVAVQIADPDKFEAYIMVSEMDILQVALEQEAWVEVDAMSGLSLPATVTHIAPTAIIQSGVVNYEVTVEIESMEAVARKRQEAMADIAAGEIPAFLQQAIDEGRFTQEEVEEMMAGGGPPEGFTPPEGMTPPEGFTPPEGMEFPTDMSSQAQGQLPAMVSEDYQLREGLTVTVTLIVEEKTDVLLVPNASITSEGGQSYVEVVTASGETEKRAIQTGITDYQFTEISDGLTEGEQIIVPQGTVTTPTTEERRGGMMFFGGPGPR